MQSYDNEESVKLVELLRDMYHIAYDKNKHISKVTVRCNLGDSTCKVGSLNGCFNAYFYSSDPDDEPNEETNAQIATLLENGGDVVIAEYITNVSNRMPRRRVAYLDYNERTRTVRMFYGGYYRRLYTDIIW